MRITSIKDHGNGLVSGTATIGGDGEPETNVTIEHLNIHVSASEHEATLRREIARLKSREVEQGAEIARLRTAIWFIFATAVISLIPCVWRWLV